MKKWLLAVMSVFVLAACGDTGQSAEDMTENEKQEVIDKGTVGFEIMGDSIEEAANVPAEEKDKLLAAFAEYIDAFNTEDIERYEQTLSKNPKGFKYEEDLETAKQIFDQYSVIDRKAEDVTVVKYSEEEAQVFANMSANMVEEGSDIEMTGEARTVVVFVKEDGEWKVSSVHSMDNQ